jgi:hypothetical protein
LNVFIIARAVLLMVMLVTFARNARRSGQTAQRMGTGAPTAR